MKMERGNSVERKVSHSFPKSRRCLGVGLIGCGTIGTALACAIDEGKAGNRVSLHIRLGCKQM